ncbi:hypothetical protein quinque_014405 [Culex quinquefasciatus]
MKLVTNETTQGTFPSSIAVILARHFAHSYEAVLINREFTGPGSDLHQLDLLNKVIRLIDGKLVVQFQNEMREGLLRRIFEKMDYREYEFSGYYLVTIAGEVSDELSNLIRRILTDLWTLDIFNVNVVVGGTMRETLIYTFFPYTEKRCGVVEPVLWERFSIMNEVDLYPERLKTFHGCTLLAGMLETKPYTIIREQKHVQGFVVTGFEGDMMDLLTAKLNFSIRYKARTTFITAGKDTHGDTIAMLGAGDVYAAVLTPLDNAAYHNKIFPKSQFVLRTRDHVAAFPVALYYPKKSHLKEVFDERMRQIQPAGLIQFWKKRYGDYDFFKKPSESREPRKLSNIHLAGGYQVFLGSLAISGIVFAMELLSSWYYAIFFLNNLDSFELYVKQLRSDYFNLHGYYTFVYNDLAESQITNMFNALWELKILKALIISLHEDQPQLYSYSPYTSSKCGTPDVFRVDRATSSLLFKPQLDNFYGCALRVGTFESLPFIHFPPSPEKQSSIEGFEEPVRQFVYGDGNQIAFFNTVQIFYSGLTSHMPKRNFARTLLFLFLGYAFLIRSMYQGLMFKYLQADSKHKPVETVDELERSDLRYDMLLISERFFKNNPAILKRARRIHTGNDSLNAALDGIATKKNQDGAVLVTSQHIAFHNKYRLDKGFVRSTRDQLVTSPVVFYYPRKSFLVLEFNRIIGVVQTAGLMSYWVQKYGNYDFFPKEIREVRPTIMNIRSLLGCYEVCAFMTVSSILMFLIELASQKVPVLRKAIEFFADK